jgi:glycerophosphoryl diester phosphodiesterase
MKVIAHRGANKEALENSFSAFDASIAAGASRIEFDVQITSDHHPIVMHDTNLRRTTGVNAPIGSASLEDIQKIPLSNGEPIPRLEEVIERYTDQVELNIEIKGTNLNLARAVAKLISSHPNREKMICSAFDWTQLYELMLIAPNVTRACLWRSFSWPFFASFAPQVFMERVHAKIIHPEAYLVDESFAELADIRGWEVYSWSSLKGEEADREGLWSMLKAFEVDGHCTNYPGQLSHWLSESNDELATMTHLQPTKFPMARRTESHA